MAQSLQHLVFLIHEILSMKMYPSCPRRTNSVLCVFTLDLAGRISSGLSAWDFEAIQESPREKQLLDGKAHKHLDWAAATAAAAKSLQSCPTLCDPIDGSPPGFPVPGILQARTLEWVAISFSNACK